jgi:hypothetical protein
MISWQPAAMSAEYLASASSSRDVTLSDGTRLGRLWQMVSNDMLDREESEAVTVMARVHPDNERSLPFCGRIGLAVCNLDSNGLVVCAGLIGRSIV